MTRPNPSYPADMPFAPAEAAQWWLARQSLGLMSTREATLFEVWMESSDNAAAYANVAGTYEEAKFSAAESEILRMRTEALAVRPVLQIGGWQKVAAAAAVVAMGSAIIGLPFLQTQNHAQQALRSEKLAAVKRYETRVGERRQVRLDDGSVISLNTGSIVEVSLTNAVRDIRLIRGEALFEVAHNSAWPFIVTAGDRHVTAIGTAFNVRLDGWDVKVVLVEGKVRVEPIQPRGIARVLPQLVAEDLTAGEQLTAREGSQSAIVISADIPRATSWRQGQVVFRDTRLSEAIEELNRYSQTRILISDPRVADLKVSGIFRTDDPANFLAAVTHFYPIDAHRTSAEVTELIWLNNSSSK
jgi:transmembrane sensor